MRECDSPFSYQCLNSACLVSNLMLRPQNPLSPFFFLLITHWLALGLHQLSLILHLMHIFNVIITLSRSYCTQLWCSFSKADNQG